MIFSVCRVDNLWEPSTAFFVRLNLKHSEKVSGKFGSYSARSVTTLQHNACLWKTLTIIDLNFLTNLIVCGCRDSFPFDFEPNGIPFRSK